MKRHDTVYGKGYEDEGSESLQQLGRWWRNYERFQWFARKERVRRQPLDVKALRQELARADGGPGQWERIVVKLALDGGAAAGDALVCCRPPAGNEDMSLFLDVARREWEANHR